MVSPNAPEAEVVIDEALIRRLLQEQAPEFKDLTLERLATGWDNESWRLGSKLLVRLPRREASAQLIEHEQRWLPVLAPALPLPCPAPVHVGSRTNAYPWSWSVVPYRPGRSAATSTDINYEKAAVTLGTLLAALHRPAPEQAPKSPVRGVPLAQRNGAFRRNLDLVEDDIDRRAALEVWEAAVAAPPWTDRPVWVHGDLHPANLLVESQEVVSVLDFGDLNAGDPATDLAVAWMLLPAEQRATFWATYAQSADHLVDDALISRARGWALSLGTVFLVYSANNPIMLAIGRQTVAAALEGGL